jgi:hypothetical protein
MHKKFTRRDFLKIGALTLGGLGNLAFNPFPEPQDEYHTPSGIIGRVTKNSISVFREPVWEGGETVGYLFRDDLINIYYELTPPEGPAFNPRWYRVWGGYIHSGYVQKAKIRFNEIVQDLVPSGHLCEVTVPYTQIYQHSVYEGWRERSRLYYKSTHWAVGLDEGPDGEPWYRLYDELREDQYHVPAKHIRLIPDLEISPISVDVPPELKHIEVSIQGQSVTAFEGDEIVFHTRISSGQNKRPDPNGIPWDTPRGRFHIMSKMPSKHMGDGNLAADGYDLPGVPWTQFFHDTGVAFHGTYWHNNFGIPMSHGCVNMRTEEAKWLFRWTDPPLNSPIEDHSDWEKRGYGTLVVVT